MIVVSQTPNWGRRLECYEDQSQLQRGEAAIFVCGVERGPNYREEQSLWPQGLPRPQFSLAALNADTTVVSESRCVGHNCRGLSFDWWR